MEIMKMFQQKLMDIFLLSSPGIIWRGKFTDPVFTQSHQTILNKQELIIHNSVTQPIQCSLCTMPTMSSIYDKPGAGWNRINTDGYFKNYFKTSDMVDVVQQEKSLPLHNSLKRITFNWWQWGILNLFAQIQTKGHFLFNMWWINMKMQCHHLGKASKTVQKWYLHIWCK
jgi:hypothetical protein